MRKYIENINTAGLLIWLTGVILHRTTHWGASLYVEWAGIAICLLGILYKFIHFKRYKTELIAFLIVIGFMAIIVALIYFTAE
ncbi:MAG: hypothetical protein IJV27_07430 [Prevotella sp.]|nr:hypothetical protein [Prevotella sp.]